MYEERRDKFTIKDILIQVLFVALFIFLLMWLFPMKKDVKNALKNLDIETSNLQPLYDQIFNNNVQTMKEAAISYYTTPRLPEKIGDEKKMTLSDMLQNNLILPFVDSDGNQCDLLESYVSITKMSDEYILKVNLKCGNYEDYVLVHLGCYNYCDDGICEKQEEETPGVNPTPTPTPTPVDPEPSPVVDDKYEYEYVKVTDGKWGEYSDWSDWTQNIIISTDTDYRVVETKTETETTYKTETQTINVPVYGNKTVQTGTKQEAYTVTEEVTKYRTVPTQEAYTVTEEVTKYRTVPTQEAYTVTEEQTVTKYRTESYIIKYESQLDCTNGCVTVSVPVWGTRQVAYETTELVEVTKYRTVLKQEAYTDTVEVTKYRTVLKQEAYTDTVEVTKYKTVPVYSTITVQTGVKQETQTVKVPVTTEVTYYRSKTREYISGTIDTKWSTSQNDQTLLSEDYSLTGNSRKI